MVFLIDLPRIDDPARVAANALTHFGAELRFFLERQGVDGKMVTSLRNYVRVDSDLPPCSRRFPASLPSQSPQVRSQDLPCHARCLVVVSR